jgi:3'(2'), 5'-bisphosphate nucleotidase
LAVGRVQLRHRQAGVRVSAKSDNSPVTRADQESEVIILAALRRIAPGIPIVAEEASAAGQVPGVGRHFFLVDPLDGTREFIAGRDEFTINIALIEDGAPVFGLVYAPALGDLFLTHEPGRAAYANVAADGPAIAIEPHRFKTIRVRPPSPSALVAVASRSHMNAETVTFLERYLIASHTSAGSSLKFCLVAKGEADVYPRLGRTCEWDTAAGHAILAAAGGTVVTLDGQPLRYGKAAAQFINPDFVAWGGQPLPPVNAC